MKCHWCGWPTPETVWVQLTRSVWPSWTEAASGTRNQDAIPSAELTTTPPCTHGVSTGAATVCVSVPAPNASRTRMVENPVRLSATWPTVRSPVGCHGKDPENAPPVGVPLYPPAKLASRLPSRIVENDPLTDVTSDGS